MFGGVVIPGNHKNTMLVGIIFSLGVIQSEGGKFNVSESYCNLSTQSPENNSQQILFRLLNILLKSLDNNIGEKK